MCTCSFVLHHDMFCTMTIEEDLECHSDSTMILFVTIFKTMQDKHTLSVWDLDLDLEGHSYTTVWQKANIMGTVINRLI